MNPKRWFRGAAAVVATVCVSLAFADTATLRVRPEVGSIHRFTMTQEQAMTMTMGPMGQQKTDTRNVLDMHLDVLDVAENGEVTLQFTYDRAVIEATTPQGTMTLDSADEDSASENPMAMMIDKPITVTMTDRAEVRKVGGFDAVLDDVEAQAEDDPSIQPVLEMLEETFSDDSLAEMFQQNFPVLPEDPVSVGSTWTWSGTMDNPAFGGMTVDQQFEVLGFEDKHGRPCVRTAVRMSLEHDGTFPLLDQMREMMAAQGQQMELSADLGRSEGAGTIWIDRETGLTVAMDTTTEFDMSMNFSVPGMPADAAGGGSMNMDMAMTVRQVLELQTE